MLQIGTMPTSEFRYLITKQATDALKAVVHTVNTELRKLKKKNVRKKHFFFFYACHEP